MSCPTVTYQPPGICRNSHVAAKYVAADLRVCDFCINTHSGATPPSRVNLHIFNRVCKSAYGILAHFLHICPPLPCHPEESLPCHPRNPSLVILRNGVTKDLKTTINHKPTIINKKNERTNNNNLRSPLGGSD